MIKDSNDIEFSFNYSNEFNHGCGEIFYRSENCPLCNINLTPENRYKKKYLCNWPKIENDTPDYFDVEKGEICLIKKRKN